jgi:hypothetical protein
MSPAASLILTLVALHVVEGLYWVRREAVAFVRGWKARILATHGPFGNRTHTFILLPPLPPLFEIFVVEPWPITFVRNAVWNLSLETANIATIPKALEPDALRKARADGKSVYAGGDEFVRTSSGALAASVASFLRAWADAEPRRRAALVRDTIKKRLDVEAVRARIELYERRTRRLKVYGNLLPYVIVGFAYGFFFVPIVYARWPVPAAVLGVLLVATWIEAHLAHRHLYPELTGDRWLKMAMIVLSFPAAARARAWLARDLLATFDPLAVAHVVLEREDFEAYASATWRALAHPLGSDPEEARAELSAARTELVAAHTEFFRSVGLDPAQLEAPPKRRDEQASAYCPRCHAEYVDGEGECQECPGVGRRRWSTAELNVS